MVKIEEGSSERTFKINGIDYNKDTYEPYYNTKIVTDDLIKQSLLKVGVRSRFQVNLVLQNPISINNWVKADDTPYSTFSELIIDLGTFLNFNMDGVVGLTQKVSTFNDLTTGEDLGDLAYVDSPQGTSWLPNSLGGTYYPAGWYVWNGLEWVSDRNAIANQLEQNVLSNSQALSEINAINTVTIPDITTRLLDLENEDHIVFNTLPELP